MKSTERRENRRRPRLLASSFEFAGRIFCGVTTDLSHTGGFINADTDVTFGTRLELRFTAPGGPSVVIVSEVVRRVTAADGPIVGFAVRWIRAKTAGSPQHLRQFIKKALDVDGGVSQDDSGMAVWHAVAPRKNTAPSLPSVSDLLSQAKKRPDIDEPERHPIDASPSDSYSEKRRRGRVPIDKTVTFRLGSLAMDGVVEDISLNGFWANVGTRTPKVGELVSCRYPLPIDSRIHEARLVGRVVRVGHDGFAVQLVRVDERGEPGTFKDHVAALSASE